MDDSPRENARTRARARSRISMSAETARRVAANEMKKGDVLAAARYAGVQAAKDAPSYLSMLDPALVGGVTVDFRVEADYIDVVAGVEGPGDAARLHALTAATVAALTIYDMCKSADRTMVIGPVSFAE